MTNTIFFDIIISVTRKYLCDDAAMAQLVEHILGKDEVPGPNPGSSSRQPRRFSFGALVFYRLLRHSWGECSFYWGCPELLFSLRIVISRAQRRNPVRIPHQDASSSLVSGGCGYLRNANTRNAPDILAAARSRSGENNTQLFSYTLAPLRYPE